MTVWQTSKRFQHMAHNQTPTIYSCIRMFMKPGPLFSLCAQNPETFAGFQFDFLLWAARTHKVSKPLTQTVEEGTLKTHYMDDQYSTHLRAKCVLGSLYIHKTHTNTYVHSINLWQWWRMTFVSLNCVTMVTIRLHLSMVLQGTYRHTQTSGHLDNLVKVIIK